MLTTYITDNHFLIHATGNVIFIYVFPTFQGPIVSDHFSALSKSTQTGNLLNIANPSE